jgi:hypothetical protein
LNGNFPIDFHWKHFKKAANFIAATVFYQSMLTSNNNPSFLFGKFQPIGKKMLNFDWLNAIVK